MRKFGCLIVKLLILSLLLTGCGDSSLLPSSSVELTSDTITPFTEATFIVTPPTGTPNNSKLSLVTLDVVSGFKIQTGQHDLVRRNDGRYEAKLTLPVGSTFAYRYHRTAPDDAAEITIEGDMATRFATIPGPSQMEETITAWSDQPYEGQTGRIIGQITHADTAQGMRELIVSAGGRIAFTEAGGAFRIDGLPDGIHHITVLSRTGVTLPTSQGALIASGTTTPVELVVRSAKSVFVTFQLTVPEGLSPDAVVRIAGNNAILGNRFGDLTGGMRVAMNQMPAMVRVDPTHFLAVLSLFEGTDLRYKYTLGDGIWNAERDSEGTLVTRQVVLTDQDVVLRDTVSAWGTPGNQPIRFLVNVPDNTPTEDQVSLQLKPAGWYEPLKMWPLTTKSWYYDLYSPLEPGAELEYRYCRNQQCGSADDADTAGPDSSGRAFAYTGEAAILEDEVISWRWLEPAPAPASISAEPLLPRPEVITGLDLNPPSTPSWFEPFQASLPHITGLGVESVIIPLYWEFDSNDRIPLLSFDPAASLSEHDLSRVTLTAKDHGLDVFLRVQPRSGELPPEGWWESAARDSTWWQLWFEEYRLFALSTAEMAAELGIDLITVGGEWVSPAIPGGTLASGEPSGVPSDATTRWRSLIEDIRAIYPGRVAFDLPVQTDIPQIPEFIDSVDVIVLHWQIPNTLDSASDDRAIAQNFVPYLEVLESRTDQFNRPLWLSIEYASIQGGAASCPPAADGSCRSIEAFAFGRDIDPDLALSFEEQSNVINAVFLAAYDRASVQGFFVRGFNPAARLLDKSSSTYGKPVEDVLRYWYPRLNGE